MYGAVSSVQELCCAVIGLCTVHCSVLCSTESVQGMCFAVIGVQCTVHCTLYRGLECEVCSVHCTRGVCSVQGSCLMRQEQITSHCPQSPLEGDDALAAKAEDNENHCLC